MQYLRRMVLVFTCVMLMGGITACGNGDNAANPDTNTGGTNQNGTVNDVTNDIGDGAEDDEQKGQVIIGFKSHDTSDTPGE